MRATSACGPRPLRRGKGFLVLLPKVLLCGIAVAADESDEPRPFKAGLVRSVKRKFSSIFIDVGSVGCVNLRGALASRGGGVDAPEAARCRRAP